MASAKIIKHRIKKMELELDPFKCKLLKHNFEIIKLLFKYGAKPISIFNAIYAFYDSKKVNIVKYLLDNNCSYNNETIRCVSSDVEFKEDFTPEQKQMFNYYYNLYDEYLFDRSCHINYDPTILQKY